MVSSFSGGIGERAWDDMTIERQQNHLLFKNIARRKVHSSRVADDDEARRSGDRGEAGN